MLASDTMADTAPETPGKGETSHVIVRPYPKIVYLYLTWIASIGVQARLTS